MRHLQALTVSSEHFSIRKVTDIALKHAKTGNVTFFTVLKEHLQADTDTKKRLVPSGGEHRRAQTTGIEFAHAVGHRTLTGEHHTFRSGNLPRVSSDDHRFATSHVLQGFRHRAQIAHAIVDNDNAHSEPFVDGIRPAMRSSGVTAMRNARPKALKMVSA